MQNYTWTVFQQWGLTINCPDHSPVLLTNEVCMIRDKNLSVGLIMYGIPIKFKEGEICAFENDSGTIRAYKGLEAGLWKSDDRIKYTEQEL